MKKVLFLFSFLLLTASANWKTAADAPVPVQEAVVFHEGFGDTDLPLGDGEEQSGEKDRDITEDDDDVSLDRRWMSRGQSSYTDLHILYQEKLFKDLEKKVVIPPPRA
jgi:hypothetical protein